MANSLIGHNVLRPVPRPLNPMPVNGVGDVRIIQYRNITREVAGVAALVVQMIANGVPAGDILVLTQSRAFGMPLYEALVANGVPTKSYYAEIGRHTSELQSLMRITYAVFCLQQKKKKK